MGVPVKTIQIVVAPLGFAMGLAFSIVPMKMILGKDFGEFRLVLFAKHPLAEASGRTPAVIQ
jgi:hypothetical protein